MTMPTFHEIKEEQVAEAAAVSEQLDRDAEFLVALDNCIDEVLDEHLADVRIVNQDAVGEDSQAPLVSAFVVGKNAAADVVSWYGAYFAGDNYEVFVDGVKQRLDKNGQIEGPEA